MDVRFSATEARVIGCLMEKSVLTPDQYPLSLNALTNACNQKSSRDPVLNLDAGAVQHAVNDLVTARHVMVQNFGSRVDKYQQRFLVRIDELASWHTYTQVPLKKRFSWIVEVALARCVRQDCAQLVLKGSAFCLDHTFERGIRK